MVLALKLSACTADEPSIIGERYTRPTQGPPESVQAPAEVGWVDVGQRFYVTTWGSSSCPMAPTALTDDGNMLRVTMTGTGGPDCTADVVANSYVLDIPSLLQGVDTLTVVLDLGRGNVELVLKP